MFDNAAKQGTDYSASRGLPPTGRFFDPTNYSGAEDQMGSGGFGLSALQRARQAGYTDAQIRTTLAGAGVEIGGKAADALNVAAGKTFYTGADGKKRPDNVKGSYSGQAGTAKTRPFLLPKGAYNHAAGKPFTQNYLFAAGGANDAELANLYLRGDWKAAVPGEYGTYSEPDWNKYVGENGYMSAFPEEDAQGNAIPGTDKTPPELRYEEKFQESVAFVATLCLGLVAAPQWLNLLVHRGKSVVALKQLQRIQLQKHQHLGMRTLVAWWHRSRLMPSLLAMS